MAAPEPRHADNCLPFKPPKQAMKGTEDFCPKDKDEWRKWLKQNHIKKEAVWLIFYKRNSPNYNLNWSESVDEALCFGWIDSTKRTVDSERYKQYFSKRKAKSNWSKINKDKVKSLMEQGLMEQEGYRSIEVAKENGSWTLLDKIEALIIPADLLATFEQYEGALEYVESLSKSAKKILLHWVISAKRNETRQKRILEVAENAQNKMKPKQFR